MHNMVQFLAAATADAVRTFGQRSKFSHVAHAAGEHQVFVVTLRREFGGRGVFLREEADRGSFAAQ